MMLSLLKIRLIQIYRIILGAGMFRAFLLCFILIPILFLFLYQQLSKLDNTHYLITGAILVIILSIHQKRKDHNFLLKISDSIIKIYYIEYVFFSIPFLVLFALTHRLLNLGAYLFLLLVIILAIRPSAGKARKAFMGITRFVPGCIFEWKSGIRQYILFILPVYFIGLAGTFLSVTITLGCTILLSIFIWSFNSICESREMLEAKELNAKNFLFCKLQQHLTCWFVFISPIFFFACINYIYFFYIIVTFSTLTNTHICSVLLKYAYYKPNVVSKTGSLFGNIVLFFSLIPGASIIILVYNFFLYRKSIKIL